MTDQTLVERELMGCMAKAHCTLPAFVEMQSERIEELEADGGAAAWILEWMLADKYRKPDVPAIIESARKHYRTARERNAKLERVYEAAENVSHLVISNHPGDWSDCDRFHEALADLETDDD